MKKLTNIFRGGDVLLRVLAIAMTLFFAACGGGGGGGGSSGGGGGNNTPTFDRSVSIQLNGQNITADAIVDNVTLNPNVLITFKQELDPRSVDNSSIILSQGDCETGTNLINPNFILTPNGGINNSKIVANASIKLTPLTQYCLAITSLIKNKAGVAILEHTKHYRFKTGDQVVPYVASTLPTDGETNVNTTPTISVTFNDVVANVNSSTLVLRDDLGGTVTSKISTTDHRTYIITPDAKLLGLKKYTVTATNAIVDEHDTPIKEHTFGFTTGDYASPSLVSTIPADGAMNVVGLKKIQLVFNKPVQGVDDKSVDLTDANKIGIDINVIRDDDTHYSIIPVNPFASNMTYDITFKPGITDISANNNPFKHDTITFTTGDLTVPTLVSSNPYNGQSQVAVDSTITVNFSKSVAGVDPTTVILHEGSISNPAIVMDLVSSTPDHKSFIFKPRANLSANGTDYVVSVDSKISDLNDATNHMAATVFGFSTIHSKVPAQLKSTMPSNGATGVNEHPTITLTFDKQVKNVDGSTVTMHDSNNNSVGLSLVTPSTDNINFSFVPSNTLASLGHYTVSVSSGIEGMDGSGAIHNPQDFSFTVRDTTIPTLVSHDPKDLATDVLLGSAINLNFSQEVKGVGTSTVHLYHDKIDPSNLVAMSVASTNNQDYTFTPSALLSSKTQYFVVIDPTITNNAGNSFQGATFSFETKKTTLPILVHSEPTGNTVPLNTVIKLGFSEAVTGVGINTVILHEGSLSGKAIGLKMTPSTDGINYEFIPNTVNNQLNSQTTYYVELLSGIQDSAGNALVPVDFSFTTIDTTVPTLVSYTPTGDHQALDSKITLQFNEKVTGVNTNTVILHEGSLTGSAVSLTATPSSDGINYQFTPSSPLKSLTQYFVEIKAEIKDEAGNPFKPVSYDFTTLDNTVPNLVSYSPEDNATNVPLNSKVVMNFDKPVQGVTVYSLKLLDQTAQAKVDIKDFVSSNGGKTYEFTPSFSLISSHHYTWTVNSGITDTTPNHNPFTPPAKPYSFTAKNEIVPTLTGTLPSLSLTSISSYPNAKMSELVLHFSQPVILKAGAVKLLSDGKPVVMPNGSWSPQINSGNYSDTYTYSFIDLIKPGDYTLELSTNDIENSQGVKLGGGGAISTIDLKFNLTRSFKQVFSNPGTSCAQDYENNLYCWGNGKGGERGDGTWTQYTSSMSKVQLPNGVTMVGDVSFADFSDPMISRITTPCVAGSDGHVYCWGNGGYGQLGAGSNNYDPITFGVNTPSKVLLPDEDKFKQVVGGFRFHCALSQSGNIYCWGNNEHGQLGVGNIPTQFSPQHVNQTNLLGLNFVHMYANAGTVCAVTDTGQVYCWGDSTHGQAGLGFNATSVITPRKVLLPDSVRIVDVRINKDVVCFLSDHQKIYCSGMNNYGQLGLGNPTTASINIPASSQTISNLTKLIAKKDGFCAIIATDKTTYCWGYGGNGTNGNNSLSNSFAPVKVVAEPKDMYFEDIYSDPSSISVCGLGNGSNNAAYCWGASSGDRLGIQDAKGGMPYSTPGKVTMPTGVKFKSMSVSNYAACAIGDDYQVYCWGSLDDNVVAKIPTVVK